MARSRLNVPIEVLRDQVRAVAAYLRHPEAIAAFAAAGLDARALEAEAVAQAEHATAAVLALGRARDDLVLLAGRRDDWKDSFARWNASIRLALDGRPGLSELAVSEVRRRLGNRPRKNFDPSREALELTLASLKARSAALQVEAWYQDPIPEGERLLADARALVDLTGLAEATRIEASQRVVSARSRIRTWLRDTRATWTMVAEATDRLPELPFDVAATYLEGVRPRKAPKSESAAGPGELVPGPGELMPGPSKLAPGPSKLMPGPSELVPGPSELAPGPSELVPGPPPAGREFTVSGREFTVSGREFTVSGREFAVSGHESAGAGPESTVSAPGDDVSGP